MKIADASFVTSAADVGGWPETDLPEVCFAGRSNVGKSSLMNCLMQRRGLVKVSSKPGKTRLVNFFAATVHSKPDRGGSEAVSVHEYSLADLPGYGYARVSHGQRQAFAEMVGEYLDGRGNLRACVLLVDVRRQPEEEEQEFLKWLKDRGLRWILVATKCDKLGASALGGRIQSVADHLGVSPKAVVRTSATSGAGRDALWRRIAAACRPSPQSSTC